MRGGEVGEGGKGKDSREGGEGCREEEGWKKKKVRT